MKHAVTDDPVGASPAAITFERLLDVLWPTDPAPPLNLIGLHAELPHDEVDAFFMKLPAGWTELRDGEKSTPGFAPFLTQHTGDRVAWWPGPFRALSTTAPAPVTCVWATVTLRTTSHPLGGTIRTAPSPDAEREGRRCLLVPGGPPPSCILHGGDVLAGIWFLDRPLDDLPRANRLLQKLAVSCGQALSQPVSRQRPLLRIPDTRVPNLIPSRMVTIEDWAPSRRYAVDSIERWLDTGG